MICCRHKTYRWQSKGSTQWQLVFSYSNLQCSPMLLHCIYLNVDMNCFSLNAVPMTIKNITEDFIIIFYFSLVYLANFLGNAFLKWRGIVANCSSLCIRAIKDDVDKQLTICIYLQENYSNDPHAVSLTSLLRDPLLRYNLCQGEKRSQTMSHRKSKQKTMKISTSSCHYFISHLNDLIFSCNSETTHKS